MNTFGVDLAACAKKSKSVRFLTGFRDEHILGPATDDLTNGLAAKRIRPDDVTDFCWKTKQWRVLVALDAVCP